MSDTKFIFPKSLGACVDKLMDLDLKAKSIKAALSKVEEESRALENHLLDTFPKDDLNGASGKKARAEIERTPVPTPEDWTKVYAYIRKSGDFDLLHKRLSTTACRERWADNVVIPGVGRFVKLGIKLSKVKAKRS